MSDVTEEFPFGDLRRPPLRYHGGKWAIAPWIISFFPEHRTYVEPFGGGAGVLLRKTRSHVEIYNDLDSDIVNVFRVLRNPKTAMALEKVCWLTPFSREDYYDAYGTTEDPVERARRTIFRTFAGYGSCSCNIENSDNGFRWMPSKAYASEWASWPHFVRCFVERLRGVTIENRDFKEIISNYNSSNTLFYIDPPYIEYTRNNAGKGYARELSVHDHRSLSILLRNCSAKVIISGYASDLYEKELYPEWRMETKEVIASGRKKAVKRTEVLWLNF